MRKAQKSEPGPKGKIQAKSKEVDARGPQKNKKAQEA